jgi:hypothetical protein
VPTLQQAIQRARPGDTIELGAGMYPGGNVVPRDKHDIVIRGVDRNRVLLNGGRRRKNGILIRADGVSVLNLSVTGFRENGVYWHDASRYRGSYLTVWNVGKYGIYAEGGVTGVFDHDYVSGTGDAAYYIGECRPCHATIEHVVAKLSAVGYSGTNSSGVVIRDSVWNHNGAGILPNSYANDALPPEAGSTIVRNVVTGSGRARSDRHRAGRLRRDRNRDCRRQRQRHTRQPRHGQRALRHRHLPDSALCRVQRPRREGTGASVATARQPR